MKNILIENLQELKFSFGAVGVKAEFESEGATKEEVQVLKDIADTAGIDFVLKIGGCEAVRDMKDACTMGVKTVVAPMIESDYAVQKFLTRSIKILPQARLLINIETINGFNALDKICKQNMFTHLSGIVFGRSDFANSIACPDVNSPEILEYVKEVSLKMQSYGKIFTLGGGISNSSLDFIEKIPYLTAVETRKIVFKKQKLDKIAIEKAINFEIAWLEYKQAFSPEIGDYERLQILKKRCCQT